MRSFFLVSLIFLGFNSFSQTDVYHPLPNGWGATYHSTHVIGGLPGGAAYTYKYEAWGGDTIINSVTYTKVYAKSSGGGNYAYSHGIRQDIPNEKVFFLDAQSTIEQDISFDQHVELGDTVQTTLFPSSIADTFIVNQIDSMLVFGDYRKIIALEATDPNNILWATYVAGIGFTGYSGFEWGWGVDCHSQNGTLLLGDPINPSCALSVDDIPLDISFQIYPNPTTGIISLSRAPNKVHVFTADGKEVKHTTVKLNFNTLDISECPSGTYHMRFEFDNGNVIKKVIKK